MNAKLEQLIKERDAAFGKVIAAEAEYKYLLNLWDPIDNAVKRELLREEMRKELARGIAERK